MKRGVQKQVTSEDKFKPDPLSIQGMLEICLSRFRPLTYPTVVVSSRTDSGVHALETTAHVDLELKKEQEPSFLAHGMNRYFEKSNTDIRVKKIQIVPESFHARYNATSRSYLYRLAVNKTCMGSDTPHKYSFPIPIGEWKSNPEFDIDKVEEAAAHFPGLKDFRTFIGGMSRKPEHFSSVRCIKEMKVVQGAPLLKSLYDSTSDLYNYWDVIVKAQSFAYRQVRRMVGVLVAAAQGKISVDEVARMIEDPINNSWNNRAQTAPPFALYLTKVEYDEKDLIIPSASENQTVSENQRETIACPSHVPKNC
ncbi:hypothetical protein J437_LFUL010043 [Ladona fulva]|uniref:tRNA pseudouridine synthase n=1 Tax=Ladona fulva TaxID=123851 RepID=A0A8K0NTZ7_LADFU|nr:hypothetical protein J437_LFUL010043 [Ladona fulva]